MNLGNKLFVNMATLSHISFKVLRKTQDFCIIGLYNNAVVTSINPFHGQRCQLISTIPYSSFKYSNLTYHRPRTISSIENLTDIRLTCQSARKFSLSKSDRDAGPISPSSQDYNMTVCSHRDQGSVLGSRSLYSTEHISADDPTVLRLFEGVKNGNRGALAQSITLVESSHPVKKAQSQILLRLVMDHCSSVSKATGRTSFRIGLSGPPGAGKSTHIEALGKKLTGKGHKVAILAVDPSSSTTGGSLLGDKTRMPELSRDPSAYIRPSPAGGNLGGVTRVTNEAIVLCEGAGYDIIIVETVGVGQSEFAVSNMVDMFSLLIPPAGGDELQGIKKGIIEVADIVVVNKADGDLVPAARRIQTEYTSAFKFIRPKSKHWRPQVTRVSSMTGEGMDELWGVMDEFRRKMLMSGEFGKRRKQQHVLWMRSTVESRIKDLFLEDRRVRRVGERLEGLVEGGQLTPGLAADILVDLYARRIQKNSDNSDDETEEEQYLNKFLSEFNKDE